MPRPAHEIGDASLQMLPSLLIVGAPRAGTTSLAAWLNGHPGIYVAPEKEVNFFSRERRWAQGPLHYASRFAGAEPGQITCDATPEYLAHELVPERLAATVPSARFVAILREPVARAYSHHCYISALGWERRPFAEVVGAELAGSTHYANQQLARGRYFDHLQRYARHLGRDQMLPLLFDDLVGDPDATVRRVLDFVGLEAHAPPEGGWQALNAPQGRRWPGLLRWMVRHGAWSRLPGSMAKRIDALNSRPISFPPIDPELRDRLRAHMAPANAALEAWIDRDLSAWARS
jgi:hypothetical protein